MDWWLGFEVRERREVLLREAEERRLARGLHEVREASVEECSGEDWGAPACSDRADHIRKRSHLFVVDAAER